MADKVQGISKITVKGFKSLYDETSIDVRPLTILAGANSSGKSSIMQPLLLMKQTFESEYTPNVFLLNGPNVKYTDASQFFHIDEPDSEIEISLTIDDLGILTSSYMYNNKKLEILRTEFGADEISVFKSKDGRVINEIKLFHNMSYETLKKQLPKEFGDLKDALQNLTVEGEVFFAISTNRCFFDVGLAFADGTSAMEGDPLPSAYFPIARFSHRIQDIIHVSGLRDNPQRDYPVAAIEGNFKGTFDKYFASVIAVYEDDDDDKHKSFFLN